MDCSWRLTRLWCWKDRIYKEKQVDKVGWNRMGEGQELNIEKVSHKQPLLVSGLSRSQCPGQLGLGGARGKGGRRAVATGPGPGSPQALLHAEKRSLCVRMGGGDTRLREPGPSQLSSPGPPFMWQMCPGGFAGENTRCLHEGRAIVSRMAGDSQVRA